jgi:hypothetical protein
VRSTRIRASILALALAMSATVCSAVEAIRSYPSLALKDGRRFAAVEIIDYTAGGAVLVRHAGGATTIRATLLPDNVISDLHLGAWILADHLGFDPDLADRPAVDETAAREVAHRPAIAAAADAVVADRPAVAEEAAEQNLPALADAAAVATENAPAIASPTAAPALAAAPSQTAPAPVGEGNIPEFFGPRTEIATATPAPAHLSGRVVVALPAGGLRMLGDVAINAYPAELLAQYLAQTRTRCAEAAKDLIEQAIAAEKNGRMAEARAFTERARNLSAHYLDYLPPAPFSTRSDEYGFFTLPCDQRPLVLVAAAQVSDARGAWTFQWIGVKAAKDTLLNEANATTVGAPLATNSSRYAAR